MWNIGLLQFTAELTQLQQMTLSIEEGETCALLQAMNEVKYKGFEESNSKVILKCW
jgi:hypothetical protein